MKRFLAAGAVSLLALGLAACGGKSGTLPSTSSLPTEPPNPNAAPLSGFQRHLKTLGEPATGAERTQIEALVTDFYDAYADVDGAKACTLLTAAAAKTVAESFGSRAARGSCASALTSEMAKVPRQFRKLDRTVEVIGARVKGDHGYAFFRSIAVLPSELPIAHEGGAWKLDSVVASPLRG
jgi:hypothetical protein